MICKRGTYGAAQKLAVIIFLKCGYFFLRLDTLNVMGIIIGTVPAKNKYVMILLVKKL